MNITKVQLYVFIILFVSNTLTYQSAQRDMKDKVVAATLSGYQARIDWEKKEIAWVTRQN